MDLQTLRKNALVVLLVAATTVVGFACMAKSEKTDKAEAGAAPNSEIAATVGDRQFTMTEVDELAGKNNAKLYQELYTARRAALDQMIADYLLDEEAKARGVSKQELVTQEVTAKVTPVTDDEISAFYEQNKARMRGRPLDQMQPQIQAYLNGQRNQDAQRAFLDKLKAKHPVKIALDVPRIEVRIAANDPRKGPDTAAVRIVEFSDFQ